MKRQVERMASEPDDEELFSDLERFVEAHGIRLDVEALLADLERGRASPAAGAAWREPQEGTARFPT